MKSVRRRKLEIIIEAPVLGRIEQILREEGVRGWSVFRGVEGRGTSGEWHAGGLSSAEENRLIIALTTTEAADQVMAKLSTFFEDYPGIVYASDVDVLRPERF